jgi:hypothetical protein
MSKGTTKTKWTFVAGLLLGLTGPAMAAHGPLTTSVRDGWIDARVQDLVSAGWVPAPDKPIPSLTNLEVAQLTKTATDNLYAQIPTANTGSPPETGSTTSAQAGKSLKELLEEFKDELAAMDVDVARLEDRIYDAQHRNEKFETLQQQQLVHTGTNLSGSSRGYFDTYRGFGTNAIYGPLDYNDIMMGDIILTSVPVPFVLFDADFRLTRTVGLYYADPIQPEYSLRWLSLTNTNDVCNLTAGDFWRHYTPLTLWNTDIPFYTFIDPTSYHRVRKDIEELAYLDHGPDWHMTGFEAASDQDLGKGTFLSSFHAQAMGGELSTATPFTFANEFAGSEAALDFFDNNLELKGAGLLLFDDTDSANVPYLPTLISTFAHSYQIGSLSSTATLPFEKDLDAKGFVEWAGSRYQDDSQNAGSIIQDWALLATGTIDVYGVHLTAKYLNNGAYFYSPGAQTNAYNPDMVGYNILDDGVDNYPTSFVFQGVGRPSFAPYDRMAENMLPYGDATPDRQGFILGFSADIGQDGWLKPQASLVLNMQEIQPDYVLTSAGNAVLPADWNAPVTNIRKFNNFEGALTVNLAKALDGTPSTCDFSVDYKRQSTDLGLAGFGFQPFTVSTVIFCADVGPFPGVPLFEGLILSGAYERASASGYEFALGGTTPTMADYGSYFDTQYLGEYFFLPLDVIRDSWALGVKVPISSTIEVHGDCFINTYTWSDFPNYDRRDLIWRMTYELKF